MPGTYVIRSAFKIAVAALLLMIGNALNKNAASFRNLSNIGAASLLDIL
jgi:hypothetical protein